MLVEIHGQHDDRALVSGEEHRRLLDAFGRLEPDVAEVAARYRAPARAGAGGGRAEGRARRGATRRRLSPRRGGRAGGAVAGAGRGGAPRRAAPLPDARGEDRRRAQRGARAGRRQCLARARRSSASRGAWSARRATCTGLLDDTLLGLNAAIDHLEEARRGLEAAIRAMRLRSGRAGADGGAALRAARRRPQASGQCGRPARGRGRVRRPARRDRPRQREADGPGESGRGGAGAFTPPRPGSFRRGAQRRPRRWRWRSMPSCRR